MLCGADNLSILDRPRYSVCCTSAHLFAKGLWCSVLLTTSNRNSGAISKVLNNLSSICTFLPSFTKVCKQYEKKKKIRANMKHLPNALIPGISAINLKRKVEALVCR